MFPNGNRLLFGFHAIALNFIVNPDGFLTVNHTSHFSDLVPWKSEEMDGPKSMEMKTSTRSEAEILTNINDPQKGSMGKRI
jgi:hypothetical protein